MRRTHLLIHLTRVCRFFTNSNAIPDGVFSLVRLIHLHVQQFLEIIIRGTVRFLHLFHHAFHDRRSSQLPLFAIAFRVSQVFITGYTKDTTVTEFLGQRDDVKVKKAEFTLKGVAEW